MADLHVNDYGTVITVQLLDRSSPVDLSVSGTTVTFRFADPDGNATDKTGSVVGDGVDGICTYTLAGELLDEAGEWSLQIIVSNDGGQWSSEVYEFDVESNL